MKLTIARRLGLLVGLAIVVSLAGIAQQVTAQRSALIRDRTALIVSQVQTAVSIVAGFSAAATTTSGCRDNADSIGPAGKFSPSTLIHSAVRPAKYRKPDSST